MSRFQRNLLAISGVTVTVLLIAQNCGTNGMDFDGKSKSSSASAVSVSGAEDQGLSLAAPADEPCSEGASQAAGECGAKTAEQVVSSVLDVIATLFPEGTPFQPKVVGSFANGTALIKSWPKGLSFDQVQSIDKLPGGLEPIQGAHEFNEALLWAEDLAARGGKPSDLEMMAPSEVSADELQTIAKSVFAKTGVLIEWVP